MSVWFWMLAACFVALILVGFAIYDTVSRLSRIGLELPKLSRDERTDEWEEAEEVAGWALHQGFSFHGAYRLEETSTSVFVWVKPEDHDYLCQYQVGGQTHYDLITIYAPERGLTTGSTKDAFTLPAAPGTYLQTFHGADLDTLLDRHETARPFMDERFGPPNGPGEGSFESILLGAMRRQMDHVRSIPFWYLRGIGWFLFRRGQFTDHPIEEIYPGFAPYLDPVPEEKSA